MEPDKSYPLHSDLNDHNMTPQVPLADSTDTPLLPPSTYNHIDNSLISSSDATPWYLRPLTKTSPTPLTTTQTRPYIPRVPLSHSTTEKAVPVSPPAGLPPRVPKPFSQYSVAADATKSADDPTKKSRTPRHRISVWIAVLLVGVLGLCVYLVWRWVDRSDVSQSPGASIARKNEQRLYHAFDLQMQTHYVRQKYSQTTAGPAPSILTLDVLSDFSVPANPQSRIDYSVRTGSGDNTPTGSGEIVILGKNEYYGKLTAPTLLYQGSDAARPKQGQWYKIASTDSTGEMLIDPLSTRLGLNSSLGEIIVGNFDESARAELLQLIVSYKVYTIRSSNEVGTGVHTLTHYEVNFNAERANDLNKKVAGKIGANSEAPTVNFTQDDVKDMEVWIDNETGRIIRVVFKREYPHVGKTSDAVSLETVDVSLSYPRDGVSIAIPDGAIAVPWQVNE